MSIVIETVSDSKQAQQDLRKLEESVGSIQSSVLATTSAFSRMSTIISRTVAIAATAKILTSQSDQLQTYKNRLRVVSETQKEFNRAFVELRKIALTTATPLETVARTYSRIALTGKKLGVNQTDLLKVTDLVGKSLKVAGASAQEANAALTQFGQAIASGRLAGDELRSILENAPTLALSISDALGVTIGQLRKLGEEGALTVGKVLKAVVDSEDSINATFAKLGPTYSAAFSRVGIAMNVLFANTKEALIGSTGTIQRLLNSAANSIFKFANDIDYQIYLVRTGISDITIGILTLFDKVWKRFSGLVTGITNAILHLGIAMLKGFETAFGKVRGVGKFLIAALKEVFAGVKSYFQNYTVDFDVTETFMKSITSVHSFVKDLFTNLFSGMTIDVNEFFPDLDDALETVTRWKTKIESLFHEMYMYVVGNSEVPDMIDEIIVEFKRLMSKPLDFVKKFTSQTNSLFEKVKFVSVFSLATLAIFRYRRALLLTAGTLASLGVLVGSLKFFKTSRFSVDVGGANAGQSKTELYLRDIRDGVKNVYTGIRDGALGRTIGGISNFGTSTRERTGPQNKSIAERVINAINAGFNLVFNGNILTSIFEPKELISSLKKVAGILLVFSSSFRKLIGGGILSALTLPTAAGRGLNTMAQNGIERSYLKDLNANLDQQTRNLRNIQAGQQANARNALRGLVGQRDEAGNRISASRAASAARSGNSGAFGAGLSRQAGLAVGAYSAMSSQGGARSKAQSNIDELRADIKTQQTKMGETSLALAKSRQVMGQQFSQFLTGLGGAVGGIAGYQLGNSIAESMVDSPAWLRISTIIGTSLVGQFAGTVVLRIAAIFTGALLASVVPWSAAFALSLGASMTLFGVTMAGGFFLAAAVGIAGLAVLVVDVFKNPKTYSDLYRAIGTSIDEAAIAFVKQIEEFDYKAAGLSIWEGFKSGLDGLSDFLEIDKAVSQFAKFEYEVGQAFKDALFDVFGSRLMAELQPDREPRKFASGGAIRGAGTGTSDSIPAMLSNGEYVINARATHKNRELLDMINGGAITKKFREGGPANLLSNMSKTGTSDSFRMVPQPKSEPFRVVPVSIEGDKIGLLDTFKNTFKDIMERSTDAISGIFGSGGSGGSNFAKTLRAEGANTNALLAAELEKVGVIGLEAQDLSTLNGTTLERVVNILDDLEGYRETSDGSGSLVDRIAADRIQAGLNILTKELKQASTAGEIPSNFTAPGTDDEDIISLRDQYDIISTQLPLLGLSLTEFQGMTDTLRNRIGAAATNLSNTITELNETPVGTASDPQGAFGIAAKFEAAERVRAEVQAEILPYLTNARTTYDYLAGTLKASGIEFGKDVFDLFSNIELIDFDNLTTALFNNISLQDAEGAAAAPDKSVLKSLQQVINSQFAEIQAQMRMAAGRAVSGYSQISGGLSSLGINLSKAVFDRLSDFEQNTVAATLIKLRAASANVESADNETARISATNIVDGITNNLLGFIEERSQSVSDLSFAAGQQFSDSIRNGFAASLSGALKGQSNGDDSVFQSFVSTFLDTITNNIIDTFVDGVTTRLSGGIETFLGDLGSGVFDLGSGEKPEESTGDVSLAKPVGGLVDALSDNTDGQKTLGESFSGILSSLGGLFKGEGNLFSTVLGMFATGGRIGGSGTGTSDSVPIMASKGEFVINAKATRENLALLESVNNGNLRKFANGGIVSARNLQANGSMQMASASRQEISINVQGDVSRQTRKEIVQMLPQITSGVNSQNRETGYRR